MDWQQKLAAIQAFANFYEVALRMRAPDDWYVDASMTIGGDGMLTGSYGNGRTPEEAVDAHWEIYANLPRDRYAVNKANLRARWNGFMWQHVSDEEAKALQESAA